MLSHHFLVALLQSRLDLSRYDSDRDGFLTHDELSLYITDLMPTLKLANINSTFYHFYICGAIRKFTWFLDSNRRGKLSISKIVSSSILTELLELKDLQLPVEYERTNWFSSYTSLRIYGKFF